MVNKIFHHTFWAALTLPLLIFLWACPAFCEYGLFNRDLFSVSFPAPESGWACGRRGIIAATRDGGNTWDRQESGTRFTLSSICFTDVQTGWAVGDVGTILHTVDGGKTWQPQKSPVSYYLMSVCFADSLTGWIATEMSTILFTRDGGLTWEVQFQDPDEEFVFRSISFCDENNGWAAGEYGFIYHTTDGGSTWEKQAGFLRISLETEMMETGNFIFDVWAVDPDTAWVAGLGKYIAVTRDNGNTWQQIQTDVIDPVHLFAVWADQTGHVIIGGNGTLIESIDNGASFQKAAVTPPVTYGWIGDIEPSADNTFFAVGIKAWIYKTHTGPSGHWLNLNPSR